MTGTDVRDVSTRNDSETRRGDTGNTRGICSGPVRYELIDKDGKPVADWYRSAQHAAAAAQILWPDQQEDPDETGTGWHVRVVGS